LLLCRVFGLPEDKLPLKLDKSEAKNRQVLYKVLLQMSLVFSVFNPGSGSGSKVNLDPWVGSKVDPNPTLEPQVDPGLM
jgi:hypothetical protein